MFNVWEVSIMEPGLAAQFPDIKTFRGQGIDDPTAQLAMDVTSLGFHAQVLSPNGRYYVDPYFHLEQSAYISYYSKDLVNSQPFQESESPFEDVTARYTLRPRRQYRAARAAAKSRTSSTP